MQKIEFQYIGTTKTNNPKLKKSLWLLSISRNALTVLITTAITYHLIKTNGSVSYRLSGKDSFSNHNEPHLHSKSPGDVPSGLPTIKLPPFSATVDNRTLDFVDMLQELGSGIVVTPIVAVLANVAIAKAFGEPSFVASLSNAHNILSVCLVSTHCKKRHMNVSQESMYITYLLY